MDEPPVHSASIKYLAAAALTNSDHEAEKVEVAIRQLKQALLSGPYAQIAKSYKALHDAGPAVIKPLLRELRLLDLENLKVPQSASLVTGLTTILHDLSEEDSVEFVSSTLRKPCHPAVESALRSIIRYRNSDYRISKFAGISILEEKIINKRYGATYYVCNWLRNVPENDLGAVSRIYIIDELPRHDFAGKYQPHMAVVTLAWSSLFHPFNPVQRLMRFLHEQTFYHEIGHHHYKHAEYGQVREQELQADAYAKKLLQQAHPRLKKFMDIFRRILRR